MHVDLTGREADAIGLVHGLDHVVDQAADSVIDLRHRLGNGVQTGIRITKDGELRHGVWLPAFVATARV